MGIIKLIFELVESLLSGLFEGLFDGLTAFVTQKRKTQFNSDFMPASQAMSRYNKGFNLTGVMALPINVSFSNCSVFAPSGAGKTSVVLIPTIYSLTRGNSSIVVNDPSGEAYEKTSGYLASKGYVVKRIDFSTPEKSEKYNPLSHAKTVSDIQRMVHLIIRNTISADSKGDPFWDRSCEMLVSLFARYLVFHAAPEYRTFANVLRLIETFSISPEKLDKLFTATNDEELINQYKAANNYGEKTLQSIIATARAALNIFSDPTVSATTSADTIDIASFRTEKVALFICNPIQHIHYFKPLSALFFENLFSEIMSRIPKKNERPIFCLLEEAATMKFSSLAITISNIRKYRAGIMLVVQDYQALVALYGPHEAHNIRTNTHAQVYLKGQPLDTCKELETILGRFTYEDEKSGSEKTRPLMSADEIRMSEKAIILLGNRPPILAKTTPYYQRPKLRKITELQPFEQPTKPNYQPPIFPIDEP
jgi:type IV secretion system protein VirD4